MPKFQQKTSSTETVQLINQRLFLILATFFYVFQRYPHGCLLFSSPYTALYTTLYRFIDLLSKMVLLSHLFYPLKSWDTKSKSFFLHRPWCSKILIFCFAIEKKKKKKPNEVILERGITYLMILYTPPPKKAKTTTNPNSMHYQKYSFYPTFPFEIVRYQNSILFHSQALMFKNYWFSVLP